MFHLNVFQLLGILLLEAAIVLTPISTTGKIVDGKSGNPIPGITVSVQVGENTLSSTTNEQGNYRFELSSGEYTLTVNDDEFEHFALQFVAQPDQETVLDDIALIRHDWKEATWNEPRKCSLCGKTDGTSIKDLVYSQYSDIIKELEKKYGSCTIKYDSFMHLNYYNGLCYAELLDMNGNGREELITVTGSTIMKPLSLSCIHWQNSQKLDMKLVKYMSFI